MLKKLSFILCLLCSANWIQANTFVVSSTSGADVTGSFANAIFMANNLSGAHTITFTGIASGSFINSANATLYQITNSNVTIDASGRNITFRGASGAIAYGITFMPGANNCVVKGLTFTTFNTAGIYLNGATGTTIIGCRFNTNPTGTASVQTNLNYGVYGTQAHNTKIGGSVVADRNYFAAIASSAVYFITCNNVVVTGNYFGITSTGNALYGDLNFKALHLENCSGSIIGRGTTAAERNLFCNSSAFEVEIVGTGTNANVFTNNYFGYDASGTDFENGYYSGIKFTNASNNLIQKNLFGAAYGNPINATGTYSKNKLRQNTFQDHSGDPPSGIISTGVRQPSFYSTSATTIKGLANPGDSIEIYYANGSHKSGMAYIGRVLVPASGEWVYTGTFTVGQTISITATNNIVNSTSWFITSVSAIAPCGNTPTIYTSSRACMNKTATLNGIMMSSYGSVGTTTPLYAGVWSSNGGGAFTNGGAFNTAAYRPSAAELTAGQATFKLTTTDTNCVNGPGVTGTITLMAAPTVEVGADKYSCSNNVFALTSTSSGVDYSNWASLDGTVTFSTGNAASTNVTIPTGSPGSYRIVRSVGSLPYYCSNLDTLLVSYKPNPMPPTGVTITTLSQQPITYTIPAVSGEVLTANYYSAPSPTGSSTVTFSGRNVTYVTSGTFYGSGYFSYTLTNQCSNIAVGSVNVNVQNAPPVRVDLAPVVTTRGTDNTVVVNLSNYFTDVNGAADINYSSLTVIRPPASAATYSLNTPSVGYITITYTANKYSNNFVGLDSFRVQVADTKPNYATAQVKIERLRNLSDPSGTPDDIIVNNGISPNGDGQNDYMYIDKLADYNNTVSIYNRWGDKVWEGENYNNTTVRFEGNSNTGTSNALPSGTYFYVIKNKSKSDNGEKPGLSSGYLVISRPE